MRSGSGPRSAAKATVLPGHLARLRARTIDDEQVRPPIAMALAVPAPVGPGDPSGARLGGFGGGGLRVPAAGADRGYRADDEPGRIDFRGEREPSAIGRPGQLGDGPMLAGPREPDARIGSREVDQGDRRQYVVIRGVGADERQAVTIGAEAGPGVAHDPERHLARPQGRAIAQSDREEMPVILVALDRAADDDRESAVGREVELLDDDDAADVLRDHRATRWHLGRVAPAVGCRECHRVVVRRLGS
jgi:hypothetical protein